MVSSAGSNEVVGSVAWMDDDDGDDDQYGDVVISDSTDAASMQVPLVMNLQLPCEDSNEDGLLDFAVTSGPTFQGTPPQVATVLQSTSTIPT